MTTDNYDHLLPPTTDALKLFQAFKSYSSKFPPLEKALFTIQAAVRLYTPSNLAVAFNGGKDATVVMQLTRAAIAQWSYENDTSSNVNSLYLKSESGQQFEQVDQFVNQQVQSCNLSLTGTNQAFIPGIKQFIQNRGPCAFVMGTRRCDPHGQFMNHFEPSSPNWPPFMRVNPILDWQYDHVWQFLKYFQLAYCTMYDHGYTSIGSVETTKPNPALKTEENGKIFYKPAYTLTDGSLERAGRISKA